MAKPAPPATLVAYRLDINGEEIVLFSWGSETADATLSPAEEDVLRLLAEGQSNQAIATARGTSVRTVANQVAGLMRKLGASSRFEIVGRLGRRKAPRDGLKLPQRRGGDRGRPQSGHSSRRVRPTHVVARRG